MTNTTNPYYGLFAAFRVPVDYHNEIKGIEGFLQRATHEYGIPHLRTGNPSEWYRVAPDEALRQIVEVFPNWLGPDGYVQVDEDGVDFTQWIYLPGIDPSRLYMRQYEPFVDELLRYFANGGNWLFGLTHDQITYYRRVLAVNGPSELLDRLCFYLHRARR